MDQAGGLNPGCFLLSIQEPSDLNVTRVEICHMADDLVVVLQYALLGRGHMYFRLN